MTSIQQILLSPSAENAPSEIVFLDTFTNSDGWFKSGQNNPQTFTFENSPNQLRLQSIQSAVNPAIYKRLNSSVPAGKRYKIDLINIDLTLIQQGNSGLEAFRFTFRYKKNVSLGNFESLEILFYKTGGIITVKDNGISIFSNLGFPISSNVPFRLEIEEQTTNNYAIRIRNLNTNAILLQVFHTLFLSINDVSPTINQGDSVQFQPNLENVVSIDVFFDAASPQTIVNVPRIFMHASLLP